MQFEKLYKTYREKSLQGRWIHYLSISSILDELNEFPFANKVLGYSFNKIPIHSIKLEQERQKSYYGRKCMGMKVLRQTPFLTYLTL